MPDRLRIGVEARTFCNAQRRGVPLYIFNLIKSLVEISDTEEYVLFVDAPINPLNLIPHPNITVAHIPDLPGYRFNSWLHASLPLHLALRRYDLAFYPHNALPIYSPGKTVVAIHDVKTFRTRRTLLGRYVVDGGAYLPGAVRRADRVICSSQFTRGEIEGDIGPLHNATVIHLGLASTYERGPVSPDERAAISSRYGIRGRFVLALAAAARYKNTNFLVESFARISAHLPGTYQLVLVGGQDLDEVDYVQTIARLNLHDTVLFTGYVPDEDLTNLYRCAECFVYPSLYEGFGFPPLEAMASGTPVLASNASAIPEVVGGACQLADATSESDFDNAFLGLLVRLRDEAFRIRTIERGYEHAKRFTWKRTATQTLEVFRQALASP